MIGNRQFLDVPNITGSCEANVGNKMCKFRGGAFAINSPLRGLLFLVSVIEFLAFHWFTTYRLSVNNLVLPQVACSDHGGRAYKPRV